MDGEKSYEGIIVKKLAGKAAMASESARKLPVQALIKRQGLGAKPGTMEEKQNQHKTNPATDRS